MARRIGARRRRLPPAHIRRHGAVAAVRVGRAGRPALRRIRSQRHGGSEGRPADCPLRAGGVLHDIAACGGERARDHWLLDCGQQPSQPGEWRGARLRCPHRCHQVDLGPDSPGPEGPGLQGVARRHGPEERRGQRLVRAGGGRRAGPGLHSDGECRSRLLRGAAARRQSLRQLDRRAASLEPASWSGPFRRYTTTCGITTTPRRRRS